MNCSMIWFLREEIFTKFPMTIIVRDELKKSRLRNCLNLVRSRKIEIQFISKITGCQFHSNEHMSNVRTVGDSIGNVN